MERRDRLREVITFFDLSRHPFYVDWRRGTLPPDRLAAYAAAFDPFIASVADGWEAAGRPQDLESMVEAMPEDDFERTRSACALLAAALWAGLDGVFYR